VANALLVRGSLTFGGAVFLLHSSVEAAMATALSLPEEDAPLTPHRPRATSRPSPYDGVNGWRRAQGGSSTRGVPPVRQRIPRIPAPNLPPPAPTWRRHVGWPARPRSPGTGNGLYSTPHLRTRPTSPRCLNPLPPCLRPPAKPFRPSPLLGASGASRRTTTSRTVATPSAVAAVVGAATANTGARCQSTASSPRGHAGGACPPPSPGPFLHPRPAPPRLRRAHLRRRLHAPPRQRRFASLAPGLWRPSTSAPGSLSAPRAGSRRRKGLRRGQSSSRARWTFAVSAFRLRSGPRRRRPPRRAGARLLRLPLQPLLLRLAAPRPAA
jgi:hypothetical protein